MSLSLPTSTQIDGEGQAEPMASDYLLQYGHLLTQHEKLEILSYSNVYYVGSSYAKQLRKN